MRVLIVDDEKNYADSIRDQLRKSYVVDVAYSGIDGEYLAFINEYDLIILDFLLPDCTGIDLCVKIRQANILAPILFTTVRFGIKDKITALDSGADDYLVKPFSLRELKARIRALMRRSANHYNKDIIKVNDLVLDTAERTLKRKDENIFLRRKEFNLLEYMLRNQNRVLTRGMILEHVWEEGLDEISNTVDVHIKYLRDKIDRPFGSKYIKTVHGLGYKIDSSQRNK